MNRLKSIQQIHGARHIVKVAAVQNQARIVAGQEGIAVQSLDPIAAAGLELGLALWIIIDDHGAGLTTGITTDPNTKVAIHVAEAHIIVHDFRTLRIHEVEIIICQEEGHVEGTFLVIVHMYLVSGVVEGHDISITSLVIQETIADLIEVSLDQMMMMQAQ